MFETAFLLAVDIGHHDLFMDLHYIALQIGEAEMAASARAQASALLSRCSTEESSCSRSSCSQCCDTENTSSDEYSSSNNQSEPSKVPADKPDSVPPLPLTANTAVTADFGLPDPASYRPKTEKESILPISKLCFTPRATYVKSPQVPSNFTKVNFGSSNISTPPLPFTPPLPNLPNSSLDVPFKKSCTTFKNNFQNSGGYAPLQVVNTNPSVGFVPHSSFFHSTISSSSFMSGSLTNITSNQKAAHNPTLYSAFSSSNLSVNNIKKSFTSINKVLTPPLPNLSNSALSTNNYADSIILSPNLNQGYMNNSNSSSSSALLSSSESSSTSTSSKKHQPKVKFSDTVTAFIVPEIKRPQRPPPPPHLTDPQKELADSLPLCHPNEDYLKDFAPAKRDDDRQKSEGGQQPKIKVVHFGVV